MSIVKLFLKIFGAGFLLLLLAIFLYLFFPSKQSPIPFDYGNWNNGPVRHILPQFDHEQLLLKTSFEAPLLTSPFLEISDTIILGQPSDPERRFFQFYITGLEPDTEYRLRLMHSIDSALSDAWVIRTFPHPDSLVNDLRILKYTCAGGISESLFGQEIFLNMKYRRALLKRALIEDPRIVIANGDHIYWDQKTSDKSILQRLLKFRRNRMYGHLDLDKPMRHKANYKKFTSIADDQIVELYGCLLRDKSVYFITDDHDLFENDDAIKEKGIVSFPPQDYMNMAVGATQELYYPEFLSNKLVPKSLPGVLSESDFRNSSFGIIRYGNLVEINLYDAKREVTITDDTRAVLVPLKVEDWIIDRVSDSLINRSIWNFQAPSSPMGWTAGKWLEWYPDILVGNNLSNAIDKYLWQEGWWLQHQRLLKAFSERNDASIILQGDLHMASFGLIKKSGRLDFSNNPIPVITTAPLGSGKLGFPSSFRGTGATVPIGMEVEELYPPVERNGFTILNANRDQVAFEIYTWRFPETMADIQMLQPSYSSTINRQINSKSQD